MVTVLGRKEADDTEEGNTDRDKCDSERPVRCGFGGHIRHAEDGCDERERLWSCKLDVMNLARQRAIGELP